MKVTIENIKGLNKDLKVLIDKETMNSYMDEKYEEIKGTVNLKGFRPGKVPREVLKRQFGKAVFGEVLDKVLKETSTKALEENKIKPAGQPKLDLKTYGEDKELEYVLSVTELPKVENTLELMDYLESAKAKIAELRPQVDVLVMLLNSTRPQSYNSADSFTGVDYLFSSRETTRTRPEMIQPTGKPMTYSFGIQGKYVGRLDVDIMDKSKKIKDVTGPMMTVSVFEKRLNNLQKRDPDKPLEEIYKDSPNVLNMVEKYKDGLSSSKSSLTNTINTSYYSLIPLNGNVASEKSLLAVVDEALKMCTTLDMQGAQSLN